MTRSYAKKPYGGNTMLPLQPLLDYIDRRFGPFADDGHPMTGRGPNQRIAVILEAHPATVHRMRAHGVLAMRVADRYACILGLHISYLWPEAQERPDELGVAS